MPLFGSKKTPPSSEVARYRKAIEEYDLNFLEEILNDQAFFGKITADELRGTFSKTCEACFDSCSPDPDRDKKIEIIKLFIRQPGYFNQLDDETISTALILSVRDSELGYTTILAVTLPEEQLNQFVRCMKGQENDPKRLTNEDIRGEMDVEDIKKMLDIINSDLFAECRKFYSSINSKSENRIQTTVDHFHNFLDPKLLENNNKVSPKFEK